MKTGFGWAPNRIAGQIAALMVAAVVVIHLVLTAAIVIAHRDNPGPGGFGHLETLLRLVDAATPAERAGLLAIAGRGSRAFDLVLLDKASPIPEGTQVRPVRPARGDEAGPAVALAPAPIAAAPAAPPGAFGAGRALFRLGDGTLVSAAAPNEFHPALGPILATISFLGVSLTLFGAWAAYALTRPLRAIADAAEAYSGDGAPQPIPARGPAEIRSVARALDRMQARITKLVGDRTRMLAAVGHDLRTPITRLRLRAEFLTDETEKARTLADLDQMDALVQGVLLHLRDGRTGEATVLADLPSLIGTIADRFADRGVTVPVEAPPTLAARVRPLELGRAIENLVENAVKYGANARMTLTRAASGAVRIEILDDGPGIDPAAQAAMFEPFVRGEAARSMNDEDGFGLGLSIARSIVEAHDGTLRLESRQPHGLTVRIELPAPAPAPT